MSDLAPLVPAEVDLRDFAYLLVDVKSVRDSRMSCLTAHEWCGGFRLMLDNLATACKKCNRSKGKKTMDQWRAAR